MIADKEVAAKIIRLMVDCGAKLGESVALVHGTCSETEFKRYKARVDGILELMFAEVMHPIIKQHPDLKPPELK